MEISKICRKQQEKEKFSFQNISKKTAKTQGHFSKLNGILNIFSSGYFQKRNVSCYVVTSLRQYSFSCLVIFCGSSQKHN